MHEPIVSIVMSVFNEEEHLANTIDSCLNQTFERFELIIIDDGSTDSSKDILSSYQKKDSRIRVIRQKNSGLAASLNTGISEARGELIARMDADDISLIDRLEKQVKFMKQHPSVDVLGTAAFLRSVCGKDLGVIKKPKEHASIVRVMHKECPFIHPSVVMRRKVIVSVGGYNEKVKRAQDYELWGRLFKEFQFHNLQEPLIVYTFTERLSLISIIQAALIRVVVGWRLGKPIAASLRACLNVFIGVLSICRLHRSGASKGRFRRN